MKLFVWSGTIFSGQLPTNYPLILLKYIISAGNVVAQVICQIFKTEAHWNN